MIELFIRKIRIEKNLTQEELSQKSGISESYISELENNLKRQRYSLYASWQKH